MPLRIRVQRPADAPAVRRLVLAAFGRDEEAELVERLLELEGVLALVAEAGAELAGQLVLSPVEVPGLEPRQALGLAPVAVLPALQRRGVGGELVREALLRARFAGCEAVVVLGDPRYYRRFGFRPAVELGLRCAFDAPPEAFQVVELLPRALAHCHGEVRYHAVFGP